MTLQDFEAQIEKLERCEIGEPNLHPAYGTRTFETDAQEACSRLYTLWGDLRRTLWAPHAKVHARELQDRCRIAIDRIAAEHGFMAPGRPSLFPAYADAAGNIHPAIG